MKFNSLIDLIKPTNVQGDLDEDVFIAGASIDSRQVTSGSIFVALPSVWPGKPGGEQYIPTAVERGARIIVTSSAYSPTGDEVVLTVSNPHQTLSVIAVNLYPGQPKNIVAITGTNGKTSSTDFTYQIWAQQNLKACVMGTVSLRDTFGNTYPGFKGMTTPDALLLHQNLSLMKRNTIEYAAMEASSHALDQSRMDSVHILVAGFTNLSHEHLDYHKTPQKYFEAKKKLFTQLLSREGTSVINIRDEAGKALNSELKGVKITYGRQKADMTYTILDPQPTGQDIRLNIFGTKYDLHFPLIGKFQVENALCAVGTTLATGVPQEAAVQAMASLKSVSGRLEAVSPNVYIDYAHTPDALMKALRALRSHAAGKIHVVFGCGGDRDALKRPEMGKVATTYADYAYVTDDNPRSEDPALIRAQILKTCKNGREFSDRTAAIEAAISECREGDLVLVAGKGHETGQIVGDQVLPYSDKQVVQKILGVS